MPSTADNTDQSAPVPMTTDMDKASGANVGFDSLISKTEKAGKEAASKIEGYQGDINKIIKSMPDPNSVPKPGKPQVSPFQAPAQENPAEAFGSFASTLGLIASALTKTPLTTSLRASAAAMNAVKANNTEAYNQALTQWKENTDLAYKQAEWENTNYKGALDLMNTDYNRGLAQIRTIASMAQDAPVLAMLKEGSPDKIGALMTERQRLVTEGLGASEKAWKLGQQKKLMMDLQAARTSGDPEAISKAQQAIADYQSVESPVAASVAGLKARDIAGLKQASYDEFKAKNGRDPTVDERLAIDQKVERAEKGTAVARSAPAMAVQKYIEEHPSATAEDVMNFGAAYRARSAAVQAFATGKQGDIVRSFNVATQHLDTLQDLGDALQNGDVPKINALANAFARETGQPAPTNFEAAKTIIGNEITKAVVGAGGTGEDRARAQSAFDAAQSPAQLKEAIATVRTLIKGQLVGLERQFVDSGVGTEDDFKRKLSGRAADELGVKSGNDISAAVKASGWDYDPSKYDYRIDPATGQVQRKEK